MDSQPQTLPVSDRSVWPRRASKACANCRRDKIRCDGERPCSNCGKKGYGDRCIDGCEACRRARVRCEDGKPCQRCRETNLQCIEEVSPSVPRMEPASAPPRMARNGTERAKLACSNCRRDNKKCDDQRPCSRCVARSEECIHVGRGPKLVKLRCEACRQSNKRCEDNRPCWYCIETSKECVAVARKGRGHGTRVKAACISCRRDKIRCDGVRPCSSCVRKGCECIDRACKACSQDGNAADCTHKHPQDAGPSEYGDSPIEGPYGSSSTPSDYNIPQSSNHNIPQSSSYYPPPQSSYDIPQSSNQKAPQTSGYHLPHGQGPREMPQQQQHTHMSSSHSQPMYSPMAPPQHYYYPQAPVDNSVIMQHPTMYMSDQRSTANHYPMVGQSVNSFSAPMIPSTHGAARPTTLE